MEVTARSDIPPDFLWRVHLSREGRSATRKKNRVAREVNCPGDLRRAHLLTWVRFANFKFANLWPKILNFQLGRAGLFEGPWAYLGCTEVPSALTLNSARH
jgi:hypothetical protein